MQMLSSGKAKYVWLRLLHCQIVEKCNEKTATEVIAGRKIHFQKISHGRWTLEAVHAGLEGFEKAGTSRARVTLA